MIMIDKNSKIQKKLASCLDNLVNIPFKIIKAKSLYFKMPSKSFYQDNLVTSTNCGFHESETFRRAYGRSLKAASWDYGIEWRTHVFLWAAQNTLHLGRKGGAYVELGTGRGWMFSAFLEIAPWRELPCNLWLFDSFKSEIVDKDSGAQVIDKGVNRCYAETFEATKANFSEWPRVRLVMGWLPETLQQFTDSKIAFLHVDLNHHIAEVASVRILWDRLMPNGIMLLDDYAAFGSEQQYDAMNQLATELDFLILTLPTGQGLVIKTSS